ncbi:MAG: hypothetical protein IH904_06930 [Proteobacteria bacterium]|nr:hypothetical protein [Pseudomonadota bacterium]
MLERIRQIFLTALLAGVVLAAHQAGAPAMADSGADHQTEQSGAILMGTTAGNINDFGTDGTYVYCCAGTAGALVTDANGVFYILSNNHVLARINEPAPYTAAYLTYYSGENTIHPGLIDQKGSDGNSVCTQESSDTVAYLSGYVPIDFNGGDNTVDAAIAEIASDLVETSGEILDIGVPDTLPATAMVDMRVTKSGRTTGQTFGKVVAVDVTVNVGYTAECGSTDFMVARFVNQIRIQGTGKGRNKNFSAGGDSGSLIVTDDGEYRAVGLLFAGGRNDTFANPFGAVLSELGVTLVGQDNPTPEEPPTDDGGKGPPPGKGKKTKSVPAGLEIASEVKARHENRLFEIPGVVGTGVSLDDDGNPVIEVYVERAARATPARPIPKELEGVPVRVIETGPVRAY